MSEERNKSEQRRNWLCDLYSNYWTFSYLSFPPFFASLHLFSVLSLHPLSFSVLETLFLKLKQKHTLGAYLILSTHTHTHLSVQHACIHVHTHIRTCMDAYIHVSIHCCDCYFTHTYMSNHNSNTLSWAHTYTIWNGMKDLWQAVSWFTTCCISMLIIFNAYKWYIFETKFYQECGDVPYL